MEIVIVFLCELMGINDPIAHQVAAGMFAGGVILFATFIIAIFTYVFVQLFCR